MRICRCGSNSCSSIFWHIWAACLISGRFKVNFWFSKNRIVYYTNSRTIFPHFYGDSCRFACKNLFSKFKSFETVVTLKKNKNIYFEFWKYVYGLEKVYQCFSKDPPSFFWKMARRWAFAWEPVMVCFESAIILV